MAGIDVDKLTTELDHMVTAAHDAVSAAARRPSGVTYEEYAARLAGAFEALADAYLRAWREGTHPVKSAAFVALVDAELWARAKAAEYRRVER